MIATTTKPTWFGVRDLVVFPLLGVCEIVAIEGSEPLYSLRRAADVFTVLREPAGPHTLSWNREKTIYTEKLRTGSPLELAEVVRDTERLLTRRGARSRGIEQQTFLRKAHGVLVKELALATGRTEAAIVNEIRGIFR